MAQRRTKREQQALKLGRTAGKRCAGLEGQALHDALDEHLAPALLAAVDRRLSAQAVMEGLTHGCGGAAVTPAMEGALREWEDRWMAGLKPGVRARLRLSLTAA